MDRIIINAVLLCNIGVTPKERTKKQKIEIYIELFFDTRKASNTDEIADTLNYSEVYDLVKNIAEKKEYNLIETLTNKIAGDVLNKFNVKKINVKVSKKLQNFKSAVNISREKNG